MSAESWSELPVVPVVAERVRTNRMVKVLCPFCGAHHEHVWVKGPQTERLRQSHCANQRRDYIIVMPSTTTDADRKST